MLTKFSIKNNDVLGEISVILHVFIHDDRSVLTFVQQIFCNLIQFLVILDAGSTITTDNLDPSVTRSESPAASVRSSVGYASVPSVGNMKKLNWGIFRSH